MPITKRDFQDAIYEQFSSIGKALGSPARLEMIDVLTQGPRTVETLAGEVGRSVATTSHHLQVLLRARLVERERNGTHVTYRLSGEDVAALFRTTRSVAERHLAEVERVTHLFLEDRASMEPLDAASLATRLMSDSVTLVDVRPVEEFEAGHIPGAVSLPLERLDELSASLPKNGEIVAYCRGRYCVLAVEAVERLRSAGFDAVRMEDGVHEWTAMGMELETGKVGV
jgi:rhodanese-related sulfurtransferase/DNA-binding MarR family transcriptional regulator